MNTPLAAAAALTALAASTLELRAQDDAIPIQFVAVADAFEEAERTGKRVLVYQDWPG